MYQHVIRVELATLIQQLYYAIFQFIRQGYKCKEECEIMKVKSIRSKKNEQALLYGNQSHPVRLNRGPQKKGTFQSL